MGLTRAAITLSGLRKTRQRRLALRGRDKQFAHDYTVPQAIRTKVPEEHYSTSYIADRAAEWVEATQKAMQTAFPSRGRLLPRSAPSLHPARQILGHVQARRHGRARRI